MHPPFNGTTGLWLKYQAFKMQCLKLDFVQVTITFCSSSHSSLSTSDGNCDSCLTSDPKNTLYIFSCVECDHNFLIQLTNRCQPSLKNHNTTHHKLLLPSPQETDFELQCNVLSGSLSLTYCRWQSVLNQKIILHFIPTESCGIEHKIHNFTIFENFLYV